MPEWGWYAWVGGAVVSFAVLETWGKLDGHTLSSTIEKRTRSHLSKSLAFAGMLGFAGWFSVHLGLI